MNHQPLVTVIIPAYNHEKYVEQAILSVLDQTYENVELIIIDDGSTDNTAAKIEGVIRPVGPRKVTFISQQNIGLSQTLNKGINLAKGEYIAFLASDDAYLPTRIEEGVKVLENAESCIPAAYSDGFIINSAGQRVQLFSSKYPVPIGKNIYKELILGNWIPALSVLYRKSALFECGLFDENCGIEDYGMLLHLSKKYHKFIYIPKPLFLYRWHSSNYSSDNEKMKRQFELIIEKHPDLRKYRSFNMALKDKKLKAILRDATMLNIELIVRHFVRKIQQKHDLVNISYLELSRILLAKVLRHLRRKMRRHLLGLRGVRVGKGVRIDGKITIIGNSKNIIISDFVRITGTIRFITGYDLERESIQIGAHTTIDHGATLFSHGGHLVVGDNCFLGPNLHIQAKGGICVGDDTMIAANTSIFASNHLNDKVDVPYRAQGERFEGITIGRNCWIGSSCVILDGTQIGNNCIIGANCVVRGNYSPGSIITNKDMLGKPRGSL